MAADIPRNQTDLHVGRLQVPGVLRSRGEPRKLYSCAIWLASELDSDWFSDSASSMSANC
jgi:hypothetical protein